MHDFFIYTSIVLIVIIFIPFYRIIAGPTLYDRMLGAGAVGSKTLVLICIFGFVFDRFDMFMDITLAYATLNFIGVIAIAKYLNSFTDRDD